VAPKILLMDPTVWLDGARPANTCIPPSFHWIRHEGMPPRWCKHHFGHLYSILKEVNQCLPRWPRWYKHHLGHLYSVFKEVNQCLIQGKEDRIQVLAGLAPSSQTVGSNKRILGATKGGSYNTLVRLPDLNYDIAPSQYNAPS